jgi:acetoacetyl-CoA synthetase
MIGLRIEAVNSRASAMEQAPLWTPPPERIAASNLARFMAPAFKTYAEVHAFSVEEPARFWAQVWDFCGVRAEKRGSTVFDPGHRMVEGRFFPEARLNYTENLLRKNDDSPALIFRGEDRVKITMTWRELTALVAKLARALTKAGIAPGDRVAAVVPNHPQTVACFLACSAIGAIWSSCSPDFGERGILDRFGQIEPKFLFACDGYFYAGKTIDIQDKIATVLKSLPTVKGTAIIDYIGQPRSRTLASFTEGETDGPLSFAQLPFDHPLYILYSSGTTGVPKCIVHRAGGILLKHLAEHALNTDTKAADRIFYFSTCGWMMWNWLVSALATGATLLLYDGSPFHLSERVLFDFAEEEGMSIFGASAKYIDALKKTGFRPKDAYGLAQLRTMMSTGSPLAPESFDFVYDAIKRDLHLASISGGTDICGCFVGGNPLSPVWRGEIQGAMLGMAVEVFNDAGGPIRGEKGELVCTQPFPSMPLKFWNDPDGQKYHNAYFARFDNLWCHGDFAEWTAHDGMVIHGRSDATLNPGGVRIGTAELYAQVETIPEILESIAIGQDFDNDVRIVLFVKLRPGAVLDEALIKRIKTQIRAGASPRHVPAIILAVADIPRTKSGKIVELAVREVVHGRPVKNREALANPEALELFRDLEALRA